MKLLPAYLWTASLVTAKLVLDEESRNQQLDLNYAVDNFDPLEIDDNIPVLEHTHSILRRDDTEYGGDDDYYEHSTNTINITQLTGDLQDWEPIKATIGVLQDPLIYNFPINYNSTDASQSYEILIFLSASLCDMPRFFDDYDDSDNGISLYYTFDQNLTDIASMQVARFENGFAQALIQKDRSGTDENLRIVVSPDSCSGCLSNDTWVFELGVSQDNPVYEYSDLELITVKDTDYESVIFQAPNDTIANTSYGYSVYLFESDNVPMKALNQSWCAVREFEDAVTTYEISENSTKSSNYYFSISDLKKNTSYSAVVLGSQKDASYGGSVFKMVDFETSSSDACKAIYGLGFCEDVAYAVPVSEDYYNGDQTYNELIELYDNYTESMYENFTYALQQVPCNASLDSRYSPIRSCDNCSSSYKKWLCGITIPRCTAEDRPLYKHYNGSSMGRNEFISNTVKPPEPYYEMLPCISTCYAIARDCPPDFGFSCPTSEKFIKRSYSDPTYLGNGEHYVACNGNETFVKASSSGIKLDAGNRVAWSFWICFAFGFTIL